MAGIELLIVFSVLLIFGLSIFIILRSQHKGRDAKLQIARALGFTPLDPFAELLQKISRLYEAVSGNLRPLNKSRYKLQNVYTKTLPDGEMYLFDLVDASGDDSSVTEQQAVAVISPHLSLPPFMLYPKADADGPLINLSNRVLTWVVLKFGDPVAFPEHPEFERRYLVSSPDPEGIRRFLDDTRLHWLSHTRLIQVQAGDDMFVLSRIEMPQKSLTQEVMSERVHLAQELFSIFS